MYFVLSSYTKIADNAVDNAKLISESHIIPCLHIHLQFLYISGAFNLPPDIASAIMVMMSWVTRV